MGKDGKDGWDNNYLCANEYPGNYIVLIIIIFNEGNR
jgi:hypothetical protein